MKRTLIILVAALAALGLILLKKSRTETSMRSDRFVLDSAWKAGVNTLTVAKKPDTAGLEKKDGKWVVAKDGFPVDTAKIGKVLGYLFKLQDKELVSKSKERLAEYGLDSAEAKHISFKEPGGKSAQVVIGKTSGADYSSTYWKWEGKDEIYRTPGNFSWDVPVKNGDWKEKKLFSATAKDVKFLDVTWKDTTGKSYSYKLEALTDTSWKMLQPADSNRVKNALANEMASRIAEMSIDDFPAPKDTNLAKVKLDSPTVSVKVGLKNGSTREIQGTKAVGGYVYAKHPDRPDTIQLSSWRFDAFKKMPFDLLEAPPPPKPDSSKAAAAALPANAAAVGTAPGNAASHGVAQPSGSGPAKPVQAPKGTQSTQSTQGAQAPAKPAAK